MALIPIPSNWLNPRFEFGDRVEVEFVRPPCHIKGTVVGMRYLRQREYDLEEWVYDVADENGTILDPVSEDWLHLVQ